MASGVGGQDKPEEEMNITATASRLKTVRPDERSRTVRFTLSICDDDDAAAAVIVGAQPLSLGTLGAARFTPYMRRM